MREGGKEVWRRRRDRWGKEGRLGIHISMEAFYWNSNWNRR